ncbi:MAG TPA: hypothetical protein VE011_12575 [Candidatus Dormibacteraeota bacterium]|nr:hypothetical protein [Candidatus Dormibacteraeota bacterium]
MASNAVPGFLPSSHGFRFANRWPPGPARVVDIGAVQIPIGDVGRGLCGGMAFAARDRFDRGAEAPPDTVPPSPGQPLFKEIVDRQFDSFGALFLVPLTFWLAAVASQAARDRTTVRDTWPLVKSGIDAGVPPMLGLVRVAGWNPLAPHFGHQVVAFRYHETATGVTIWIYDPNHPGDDDVRLTVTRRRNGGYAMAQSTSEPLLGILALPFRAPG